MKPISGGVTAALGFNAAGIHCGVKAGSLPSKKDLALIACETRCAAAGVFTLNKVKAAPVILSNSHLTDGAASAVIVNSGNANACAPREEENALIMAELTANGLGIPITDVLVASTGVIGQQLNTAAITNGFSKLLSALGKNSSDAAEALMTTDTYKKEYALEYAHGGKTIKIGGICKGSGMIHPNMGTLLCIITTDAAINPDLLNKALHEAVRVSLNRISVDGDTSTNDSCFILASGLSGAEKIDAEDEAYAAFQHALKTLCIHFARLLAADGEGACRLITCVTSGAPDELTAEILGKAVISSSLVKAAIFGADANVGRVLCAMGYSGAEFDLEKVAVTFTSSAGSIAVCHKGKGLVFDEDLAEKILSEKEITIDINLYSGNHSATCWGCDLTYDYVKINGDYRS
ncbi:MAG: bifunctional glutamate N-acetyltransferase/amino-acid acetyltransferase ArgJ [Clostridiales bacterium]|jgi:glutamate N-acetyltransferase/amino-acid N-acetyltransferase|nr:bifunctional glutamate N-acetyltransferase/amino-acid acetyltransferase ArgJ [Clostridiales bacterium]